MLFSLILPVHNVELYIEKCLLSCLQQDNFSPRNYELIIVDDESPDKSIEIAENIILLFPDHNIKIIGRKNGGLSAARNTGLNYAQGEYIWFIDSDDWVASTALHDLSIILDKFPEQDIVTFTHRTVYSDGRISTATEGNNYQGTGLDFLSKNSFLSACCCVYSSFFLNKFNLKFKEGMLWEDSEFNLRAYSFAQKHYFYNKPLYYYLRRANSITTTGTSLKMVNSRFQKIESLNKFLLENNAGSFQRKIISKDLAITLVSAVAGFPDLESKIKKEFRKRIAKKKTFYYSFFYKSQDLKLKIVGLAVVFMTPLAEKGLRVLIKRAIQKGG